MKKTLIAAMFAATMGLIACGQSTPPTPGPVYGEVGSLPQPVQTGPAKTKAEVQAELVAFKAACKADPKLMGCSDTADKLPVVGTAKTRAEVSAELAAFLAACKATPKADGCPTPGGQ